MIMLIYSKANSKLTENSSISECPDWIKSIGQKSNFGSQSYEVLNLGLNIQHLDSMNIEYSTILILSLWSRGVFFLG